MEDQVSTILVDSDITQFNLERRFFEVETSALQSSVLEYAKVLHQPQSIQFSSREFYHRHEAKHARHDELKKEPAKISTATAPEQSLLQTILSWEPEKSREELLESDLFRLLATRRSTRRFQRLKVEEWKVDKILAAADTAPTAGNFQGFQVFYIKNNMIKEALVEAANNQLYVNAPVVLVFFTDPLRVKLNFPPLNLLPTD